MSLFWIILVPTCLTGVHLQYIQGTSAEEGVQDPLVPQYYPAAYNKFFYSTKTENDIQGQNEKSYYPQNDFEDKSLRKYSRNEMEWSPNLIPTNEEENLKLTEQQPTFTEAVSTSDANDSNTQLNFIDALSKKNFSPWGGKRGIGATIEHRWKWKKSGKGKEPLMPKRVRFSPWGGKRTSQTILKPGFKSSNKLIFSSLIPEISKLFGVPTSAAIKLEDYKFIPMQDKRHPIKILALSSQSDKSLREALPFKSFMETLPKLFKPGHTYADVSVKKDGKRKVKFSTWGGKRSPPIIGPIWTPASQDIKDATLNAIVIIRNLASTH